MKKLTSKTKKLLKFLIHTPTAIIRITHHRMTNRLKMDTNLMRPSRLKAHIHKGHRARRGKKLFHLKMRHTVTPRCRKRGHFLTILITAPNRCLNGSQAILKMITHKGRIIFLNFFAFHLSLQRFVARITLGNEKKPRSIKIETMNKTRTILTRKETQMLKLLPKQIDESCIMTSSRMHRNPRRLLNNRNILIFIKNRKFHGYILHVTFPSSKNAQKAKADLRK